MFRLLAKFAAGVIAPLILVSVSSAATVPFTERGSGTLTNVVPGHLAFAVVGRATYLGRYSTTGGNDFDEVGNVLNGQFTTTAADGATISGIYSGTYAPLPSGQVQLTVHLQWQVGTGRLAGITGEADVVALADGVFTGAAVQTEGFGHWVLP